MTRIIVLSDKQTQIGFTASICYCMWILWAALFLSLTQILFLFRLKAYIFYLLPNLITEHSLIGIFEQTMHHLFSKFYSISTCLHLLNIMNHLKIIWGFLFFQMNCKKTSRNIVDLLTICEGKFICTEWLPE